MASKFRQKLGIMSEEELKDLIHGKIKEKDEKDEEKKDDEEVKEVANSDVEGDEEKVEEMSDEEEGEEDDVKEASDEDSDEDEVEESSEEEEGEEDDEEVEEAAKDDADAEFDINDDSDVFLDDEEEDKVKESADSDEDDEEKVEEAKDEEDDEEKVEEAKDEEDDEEKAKKPTVDVEEDVTALLNGEDLSENFKSKAKMIMEGAVKRKVLQYAKTLKLRYNKKLRSAKDAITEKVVEHVDDYLDYVVEGWMEENKVAVEHGIRTEITEEFINDLRNLFETHNIMIPKGKENLVESQAKAIESLQTQLNEQIKKNVSLRKVINEQKKVSIFRDTCEGLTDTQIEKFKSLTKDIGFDDSYSDKLNTIKESYFSAKAKKNDDYIKENFVEEKKEPKSKVDEMDYYVNALKRSY